jgi:hypothetical protein
MQSLVKNWYHPTSTLLTAALIGWFAVRIEKASGLTASATLGFALRVLRRFNWIRRTLGKHFRIGFEFLGDFRDAARELRILAPDDRSGVVFDHDVWIDAMAFNHPQASGASGGKFRHENLTTVEQRAVSGDADNAAPGALADQRAKAGLLEHVRKDVAVGSGGFIDQAYLGPVENGARVSVGELIVSSKSGAEQIAAQAFNQHLRNVSAAIAADIDNQGFLADLRIVILDEFADAVSAHVGDVKVAHFAVGSVGDELAVVGNPVKIDQICLAGDGAIRNGVRALRSCLGIDGELNGTISLVAQELIRIVLRGQILAVDRQDVIPFLHVDTDFR